MFAKDLVWFGSECQRTGNEGPNMWIDTKHPKQHQGSILKHSNDSNGVDSKQNYACDYVGMFYWNVLLECSITGNRFVSWLCFCIQVGPNTVSLASRRAWMPSITGTRLWETKSDVCVVIVWSLCSSNLQILRISPQTLFSKSFEWKNWSSLKLCWWKYSETFEAKLAKLRAQSTANFPAWLSLVHESKSLHRFISDVPTHWNKDQKGTVNENMLTGSNSIQRSNPRETFQLQSHSSQHRAPHLSHGFQAVVQFEAETEGGFHIS